MIRAKFIHGQIQFSQHAVNQLIARHIVRTEVNEAVSNAQIIEDYPGDKYGPSCLLLGFTQAGRPLHIQCTYPSRPHLKVITVYEPDPARWINLRLRRADHES